ncbi:unnamed protein product [Mytilus coruscus]|uniref:Receptor ligand binding region domain-containing protein n=1 Tax=Mytilus coruscus TaxID=42192 RepID=A0A6J8A153_MYTCO|nr:unnamed protein product [Mytilus coruscus]
MVPSYPESRLFSNIKIRPAIEIGIEKVQSKYYLPFIEINETYVDTECNAVIAPVEAFRAMNTGTNVFFGPVCDYSLSPVARYAPFWKIPIISTGGFADDFKINRKNEYPTLTRIMPVSFDSVAIATLRYIDKLKWRKVFLITERTDIGIMFRYWFLLGSTIGTRLRLKPKSNNLKETFIYDKHLYDKTESNSIERVLPEKIGNKYASKCNM